MRTRHEIDARLGEIRSKRNDLTAEVANLDARSDQMDAAGYQERRSRLNTGITALDEEERDLRAERTQIEERLTDLERTAAAGSTEAGAAFGTAQAQQHRTAPAARRPGDEHRDAALRTIERHEAVIATARADVLDRLVRSDPTGIDAEYLAAVGDEHYDAAFGILLSDPTTGHLRMTAQQTEALRRVGQAQQMRAMSEGTTTAGGFGVPFALDPSIILSSDGSSNPLREMASVRTIATSLWKGVSSAGITAGFSAEATETTDDAPTLAQPTVYAEKAQAFVPFSIEVDQDYAGLREELARLLADAKDQLEATKFLEGAGHASNEPAGLLTGLTNTVRVQTATADTTVEADVYSLKQSVGPRFTANASWLGAPSTYDAIYRMVGGGSDEPPLLPTREGPLLGRPKGEHSGMDTSLTTTGDKLLVYGDFQQFQIIDRIGLQIEVIPHLLGANRRPTGQRGLYAYWRTGSGVLVEGAFSFLEVA